MLNTFINPVVNPDAKLGVSAFDEMAPVKLWPHHDQADIEVVIRAVYRQVLGNAHIMESERLIVPESQLKQGEISVRDFVRQVAKSELYRTRFFDPCPRYRTIELNFKHLLGRAPADYAEMRQHSQILDQQGFAAEIDAYIDSDEYQQAFGEDIVPYYRGYKTQSGQNLLEFTNLLQLLPSASSSDKDLASGNRPRLTRSLLENRPFGKRKAADVDQILATVFKPSPQASEVPIERPSTDTESALQRQIQEQETLIAELQRQLADLRPFASLGSAVVRQGTFSSAATPDSTSLSAGTAPAFGDSDLQRQAKAQAALIDQLRQQVAEARSLALVGEARANKWRSRVFRG